MVIFASGIFPIFLISTKADSGRLTYPSSLASVRTFSIERPEIAIFRPYLIEASMKYLILYMLDENVAMIKRFSVFAKISFIESTTTLSDGVYPGLSTFVLSQIRTSTPSCPNCANLARSILLPSNGE